MNATEYLSELNATLEQLARKIEEINNANTVNVRDKKIEHVGDFDITDNKLVKYHGSDKIVKIPDTIDIIGEGAFYHNNTIEEVYLPDKIIIEDEAFCGCSHLRKISEGLYSRLKISSVGNYAFYNCLKLSTNIQIIENNKPIGEGAFEHCENLVNCFLPRNISILESAFSGCSKLSRICDVSDSCKIRLVGEYAFYRCRNLISNIYISDECKIIKEGVFDECESIQKVVLPSGIILENNVFSKCKKLVSLTDLDSICGIASVGEYCFYNCVSLSSKIQILDVSFKVREGAFSGCSKLKVIYLPDGISIESEAFEGCTSLERLSQKKSLKVKEIDTYAFDEDNNIITKLVKERTALEQRTIYFEDFLVRVGTLSCIVKGHKIVDIEASIYCLDSNGKITFRKIPAYYCNQCDKYYILESSYQMIKKNYILLCRVIVDSIFKGTRSYETVFDTFNEESIMRQYGYTVNAQDSLSFGTRIKILSMLLESRVLTKAEISSHLDWLIQSHKADSKFLLAISKWQMDRNYVENYDLGELPEAFLDCIRIKKRV